jgi:hypothetical protein
MASRISTLLLFLLVGLAVIFTFSALVLFPISSFEHGADIESVRELEKTIAALNTELSRIRELNEKVDISSATFDDKQQIRDALVSSEVVQKFLRSPEFKLGADSPRKGAYLFAQ